MKEPSQLDLAQLKFEMRQMYGHLGFEGSLQVFYEMLVAAQVLAEVIMEEKAKDEGPWHWPYLRYSDGPEYACRHGVGHSRGIHGCEGCCNDPNFPKGE
jgi:hypothetical protein